MFNNFTVNLKNMDIMNRATLAIAIILSLLTSLFLIASWVPVKADPGIYTVRKDGTGDFDSIQQAINNATEGDTIVVYNGTYFENIIINKSLSIMGADREFTIIDGNSSGTVILIQPISTPFIADITVSNFTIRNSGIGDYSGIYLRNTVRINVSHNLIDNNYYGVRLRNSVDNIVSHNTITNNEYGISFEVCIDNVVSSNVITSNFWGIFLLYSDENMISRNIISSNTVEGINFIYCKSNTILENDLINNNPGIYLFNSGNNTIYRNNFDNPNQIETNETKRNYWDNSREGNYWSDYAGLDIDKDGIGNVPYNIDGNNVDNHPLMGVFALFSIITEVKTYHVSTICYPPISGFNFSIGRETGNRVIRFNVMGEGANGGLCRVMIPTDLMKEPYIMMVGMEEINATRLNNISNETYVYYYLDDIFDTVYIISSNVQHLYLDLRHKIFRLEEDLVLLNMSFRGLQNNHSQLQLIYLELNSSYHDFLDHYSDILSNLTRLQSSQIDGERNTLNLTYSFAAMTAIFLIVIVYLSKNVHLNKKKSVDSKTGSSSITP
jgi:parallel beta-helix repeat protein